MRVIVSSDAAHDLEAIADFIAIDHPERAVTFILELDEKAHQLVDFPGRFPLVPEFAQVGIRRRVYGDYLIFYRIADDVIMILRYLHGARDYVPLLSAVV